MEKENGSYNLEFWGFGFRVGGLGCLGFRV